jgi:hypothetical protein
MRNTKRPAKRLGQTKQENRDKRHAETLAARAARNPPPIMANLQHPAGACVRVARPNKPFDTWVGRVVSHRTPVPETRSVAFRLPGTGYTAPGLDEPYTDPKKFTHVLLPADDLRTLSEAAIPYDDDDEEEALSDEEE